MESSEQSNPHLFWKQVEKQQTSTTTTTTEGGPPALKRNPSWRKMNVGGVAGVAAAAMAAQSSSKEQQHTQTTLPITPTPQSPVLLGNTAVNGAFDFWRKVAGNRQEEKEGDTTRYGRKNKQVGGSVLDVSKGLSISSLVCLAVVHSP